MDSSRSTDRRGATWWGRYIRWTDSLYLSIRARILICYFLVLLGVAGYVLNRLWNDIRPFYREAQEEVMVDAAHLLASLAESTWSDAGPDFALLEGAFARVRTRAVMARIYELEKTQADLYAYITDAHGRVLFNTLNPEDTGSDFSRWNDVLLTLHGDYGARTTSMQINGVRSSVLIVGAPIIVRGQTVGVFSLAKPTSSMQGYIERARRRVLWLGLAALAGVAVVGVLLSAWITYPIENLIRYAKAVRDGRTARLPYLGHSEIRTLGNAFEEMRDAIEGKDYVNRYVQTLTHELKSPLAAIQGAAELLEEEMPPEDRKRFLTNIHTETTRIAEAIESLLLLASVESKKGLERVCQIDLRALVARVCARLRQRADLKRITLHPEPPGGGAAPPLPVEGDEFLLERALTGLLENAIDFSPAQSIVSFGLRRENGWLRIQVTDSGCGIPDYAMERVFERFYSLPRPDTGKKSSGLGLALIREIALLHGGRVFLSNRPEGGTVATFELPVNS